MDSSDSERELKKKGKLKKHKDKDSGDEGKEKKDRKKEEKKERMDREKEERKARMDREKEERKGKMDKEKEEKKSKSDKDKEERKEKKDKEKEERDSEKEERKSKKDKEKEERKEKKDKEKEGRKERRSKERDERDEKKKHKEEHKYEDDKKDKPSYPSGSGIHTSSGSVGLHDGKAANLYNPAGAPSQPPQSGEVPWFLREPDSEPGHHQPSRVEPGFPVQSPPPQYSPHPPSQQQPFQAVGGVGGMAPTQNVPPSGYRIPLSPNAEFPAPDRAGRPPAVDLNGSTPVFIGSAIFPNSVHPCKIIPSPQPLCRVLYDGSEVEHHGRYDLLPITQDMEWVPAKHGELPPGRRPIEGGYESNGNKLYHALGFIRGVQVPGKAGQHLRGAVIPFEGGEHHLEENYSVLCWK